MSVIVITGASSGIGRAAAIALAQQGHEVAVVGRDPDRTREVAAQTGGTPFLADFDRVAEVRELATALAEHYPRIDVLANNAGGIRRRRERSADGFERTWQHNVLAPFVLTTELLPRLQADDARVIFTGSIANRWGTVNAVNPNRDGIPWAGGWSAYGAAKRADIMLAKELARRSGLESYSFHPGFIASRFAGFDTSPIGGLVARIANTPEEGAAPLVFLATAERIGVDNGTYFDGMQPDGALAPQANDPAEWAKLWTALERQAAKLV